MGDLLFVQSHLWMGHGNPDDWLRAIERLETLDLQTVVPGHGPLGTRADFATEREYIQAVLKLARKAIASGQTADQAADTPVPAEFAAWRWREGFTFNMQFLHSYLSKQFLA